MDTFGTYAPMQSHRANQHDDDQADTPDDDDCYPGTGSIAVADTTSGDGYPNDPLSRLDPPREASLTRDDTYAAQADMRRRAAADARAEGHATVRRIGQRALSHG